MTILLSFVAFTFGVVVGAGLVTWSTLYHPTEPVEPIDPEDWK